MPTTQSGQPQLVSVQQSGPPERLGAGLWRVHFLITNLSPSPVSLLAAWLPHGKFRSDEQTLEAMAPVPTGGSAMLAFPVESQEEPGTVVENAFVILRVQTDQQAWRVLARLAVSSGTDGTPDATTVLTTAHPIGFSQ